MVGAPGEITNRGGARLRHLTTTLRASQLIYELVITLPGLLPPIIFHKAWEASGEGGLSRGWGGGQAGEGPPGGSPWLAVFPTVGRCGAQLPRAHEGGQAYVPGLERRHQGGGPRLPWFRAEEGSDAWVSPAQNHRSVCLDLIAPNCSSQTGTKASS